MGSHRTTAVGFAILFVAGIAAIGVRRGVQPDDNGRADAASLPFQSSPRQTVSRSVMMNHQYPAPDQATNELELPRQNNPETATISSSHSGENTSDRSLHSSQTGKRFRSRLSNRPNNSSQDTGEHSFPSPVSQPSSVGIPTASQAVTSPARQDKTPTSVQSPRLSVAATLVATSTDSELSELGAHQKAAILELGSFVDESSGETLSASPQADSFTPEYPLRSESDEYLRATLGHDGFNQLSFLAAAKRQLATQAAASSN